jgi:hypothetical protein
MPRRKHALYRSELGVNGRERSNQKPPDTSEPKLSHQRDHGNGEKERFEKDCPSVICGEEFLDSSGGQQDQQREGRRQPDRTKAEEDEDAQRDVEHREGGSDGQVDSSLHLLTEMVRRF